MTLVVLGIYVFAPFIAGLIKTSDRRGPKIFIEGHHELLYRFGYYMARHHQHDGKLRVPYMQKRSWFYGIQGERLPERQMREKPATLSRQR